MNVNAQIGKNQNAILKLDITRFLDIAGSVLAVT